jgi:hypothetical protein
LDCGGCRSGRIKLHKSESARKALASVDPSDDASFDDFPEFGECFAEVCASRVVVDVADVDGGRGHPLADRFRVKKFGRGGNVWEKEILGCVDGGLGLGSEWVKMGKDGRGGVVWSKV